MICKANATDIIYTDAISGIPANFLKESLKNAGYDIETLKKSPITGGKLKSMDEEAKSWKTIWSAGHGVSNIHDIPKVAELVARFKTDYNALKKTPAPHKPPPRKP